jgi:hypothetical protein
MGPEMFIAVVTSVSFSTKRAEYETIYLWSQFDFATFDTAHLADISSRPAFGPFRRGDGIAVRRFWSLVEDGIVHPDLLGEAVEAVSVRSCSLERRDSPLTDPHAIVIGGQGHCHGA